MAKTPFNISTRHGYSLLQLRITTQENNCKKNIANARKYGVADSHVLVSNYIRDFTWWVKREYRKYYKKPEYNQKYIIYGYNLYVFNASKTRLITMYKLPECYHEDATHIKRSTGRLKTNKIKQKRMGNK